MNERYKQRAHQALSRGHNSLTIPVGALKAPFQCASVTPSGGKGWRTGWLIPNRAVWCGILTVQFNMYLAFPLGIITSVRSVFSFGEGGPSWTEVASACSIKKRGYPVTNAQQRSLNTPAHLVSDLQYVAALLKEAYCH